MKRGDIVTIAEGDFAGQKGIIDSIGVANVNLNVDGKIMSLPRVHLSIDDEVKRVYIIASTAGIVSRNIYTNKDSAVKDADTLSKKSPGRLHYVMESVAEIVYEQQLTKKRNHLRLNYGLSKLRDFSFNSIEGFSQQQWDLFPLSSC